MTGPNSGESQPDMLLSPLQFAKFSGWSLSTVRRLIEAKAIPCYQPGGKGTSWRIPSDALSAAAKTSPLEVPPPPPPSARSSRARWRKNLPR